MAFKPSRAVSGRDVRRGLMDNSQNLTVGEVIIPGIQGDTSVVLTGANVTTPLLGAVVGINGVGATGGRVSEMNSYAAESDNVTDKLVKVDYVPFYLPMEWTTDLNAAAETTDNSGAFGNFQVDSTGLLLLESSVVAYSTIEDMQFFSFGLTGLNTTQVEVRCIRAVGGTNYGVNLS
jgi:hypothetical protein